MPKTIQCPFCAEEILSEAKKCKHCGEFLDEKPTVIERTSKKLKGYMLVGGFISAIGLLIIIVSISIPTVGWSTVPRNGAVIGSSIMIIGIMIVTITRIRAWWHHG